MNRLIPPQDIGMPYHGLALNGEATVGLKTVSVNGTGPCTVVRHPSAQGNRRNIRQQKRDAALGFEWRDYALLCGYNRAVNFVVEYERFSSYEDEDGRSQVFDD